MDTSADRRPRPEHPPSRWERLLLIAEGMVDVDSVGDDRRSARDWVVDAVLFGFAALAAVATAVNARGQVGTALFLVDAGLAVPACLSLWARRRHPTGVAWLTVVLSTISNATVHAGQVAIFSAAIQARPRRAVEATLAGIAATAVNCAIYTAAHGRGAFDWDLFLGWSQMTIAAFALGSFVRVRRQLVRRLRAEGELRVRDARLVERARIAREMHDVLAHRISLLSVHAGALEVRPDATPEEISRAAGVIRVSARAAQEELREVIGVLRTDPGGEGAEPPQPTIEDLEGLVEESRHAGLEVTLDDRLDDRPLPILAGRTIFRVVQEALTNARKHAPTQRVAISIVGEPGGAIDLEVANRPAAGGSRTAVDEPPRQVGSGSGLVGLAERLALAGGTLDHRALPGGGFRLEARIPWEAVGEERGAGGGGR